MKTRERILVTALELSNTCGEPNATTVDFKHVLLNGENEWCFERPRNSFCRLLRSSCEPELDCVRAEVDETE